MLFQFWREIDIFSVGVGYRNQFLFPPMSNLPELTGLFARLASQFEAGNPETSNADQSDDVLVAALNQSLNLSEQSRVRVLDTALSLMCFTAPQVFDTVIDYSVNTIVSVLSSSIECKVLRSDKAEFLRIGGSISTHDCVKVMESCADVLGKLTEHDGYKTKVILEELFSRSLLYAVVRVAVMTTQFQYKATPLLNIQSTEGISHALSKLVYYIPKRISLDNQDLQLRLLIWYLDPQTLVEEVSQLLQDVVRRPFISLSEELYEKIEYRVILIRLALSPAMFIETIALLHSWFLRTGLASVLELQVGLVSMILDLLSRPMWWGLSVEVGSKLPFSHAYFPFNHQLFTTLTQPMSCAAFLELVHRIKKSVSQTNIVDHKSTWAMTINFPDWFYFSSLLLSGKSFSNQDSSCSEAAAWYIAWILDPIGQSVLMAEKLETLSKTLVNKLSSFSENKKLKKPKYKYTSQSQTIRLWLEEYQVKTIHIQKNLMCRRVTLGILIGCYDIINEEGCELLLHYVATGTIQSTESQLPRLKDAVAGACIVFQTTDLAEKMSDSISEDPVDFISQIKIKIIKYLLKCVNQLLHFEIDQNNHFLFIDLHRRILRWRRQGKDVFHKDLDDVINTITSKLPYS